MALEQILQFLKQGDIPELLRYLDDIGVSNEMVKEHLMGLSLQKDVNARFDKIETKTKSAFTREYNKQHQEIKKIGKTKGGKGAAAKGVDEAIDKSQDSDNEEEESSEEEQDVLMDEEQMNEIKNAKKLEKQQKRAENAQKRLRKMTSLTMVTKVEEEPKGKAGAKATGKKGKKK